MSIYYDEESNKVVMEDYINKYDPITRACSQDAVTKTVLSSAQVEAVELVVQKLREKNEETKKKLHEDTWKNEQSRLDENKFHINHDGQLVVYITEFTIEDDYGSLRRHRVFADEKSAWEYVLKERDCGAKDISVMPRVVTVRK